VWFFVVGLLFLTQDVSMHRMRSRPSAPRRLFTDMDVDGEIPLPPPLSRALDGGVRGMEACRQLGEDSRSQGQPRRTQLQAERRQQRREEMIDIHL
jgi:hypothetical protein